MEEKTKKGKERKKTIPNPEPAFVDIPELPELELGKGMTGKKSKLIVRLLELQKRGLIPSILPTPVSIPKDNVIEIAQKCLNSMLETQLSETGRNTYTDWLDIDVVEIKEKIDPEIGYAFAYCIDFCVSMDYFFESDHKEYYQVLMTDWGDVIRIAKNDKD